MNRENVKQVIQELARQNFQLYPKSYPVVDGLVSDEASENISDWAKNMWDNRNEEEIECDKKLGIGLDDYIGWAHDEFGSTL